MYTKPTRIDEMFYKYQKNPEYYQQQFAPVWRQFKIVLLITFILGIALLAGIVGLRIFMPDINIKIVVYATIIPLGIVNLYFMIVKVRCPKCNDTVLLKREIGIQEIKSIKFWFTGICPGCNTKIK